MAHLILRISGLLILIASFFLGFQLVRKVHSGGYPGNNIHLKLQEHFFWRLCFELREMPRHEMEEVLDNLQATPKDQLNATLVDFMKSGDYWKEIEENFVFSEDGLLLDDWGFPLSFEIEVTKKDGKNGISEQVKIWAFSPGENGHFENGNNDDIVTTWENLLDGTIGRDRSRNVAGYKLSRWQRIRQWVNDFHPFLGGFCCFSGLLIATFCELLAKRYSRLASNSYLNG